MTKTDESALARLLEHAIPPGDPIPLGCGCIMGDHATVLCAEHWELFCAELDNPRPPTEALRRLMSTPSVLERPEGD